MLRLALSDLPEVKDLKSLPQTIRRWLGQQILRFDLPLARKQKFSVSHLES